MSESHLASVEPGSLRLKSWPLACAIVAGLVVWQVARALISWHSKYRRQINVPVVNLEESKYARAVEGYLKNAAYWYRKGREQYPNQPFQLWGTEGYMLIIPETWVDEIKDVGEDVADNEALIKSIIGEYEWISLANPVIGYTVTSNLTPKIGTFVDDMLEEIHYSIGTHLPHDEGWTSVNAASFMMKTVAMASGRVFVGTPLNRDPVWMQTCIDIVVDIFKAGERLRTLPYWLGVLGVKLGLFKTVNAVYQSQRTARRLILPIIKARAQARRADSDWKRPNDMIQFIMDAPQSATKSFKEQAEVQLIVALVSIQTTAQVAMNMLYDLCAHPEYLTPLREEVERVLSEEGGTINKKALAKMNYLDSFLKESQRLHPLQMTTFDRIVAAKKGITFQNGFHMPHGTRFAVAAAALHTDPQTWSQSPDVFDGFRFAKLRSASKADATKYQFVNTNPRNSMSFGHGRHACPGRFLASTLIKSMVATLIVDFDLRFAGGRTTRPDSLVFGHNARPNPEVDIEFRRRGGRV